MERFVISTYGRTASKWMHRFLSQDKKNFVVHGTVVDNQYDDAFSKQQEAKFEDVKKSSQDFHEKSVEEIFLLMKGNAHRDTSRLIHIHAIDAAHAKVSEQSTPIDVCYIFRNPLDRAFSLANHFSQNIARSPAALDDYKSMIETQLHHLGIQFMTDGLADQEVPLFAGLALAFRMDRVQIQNAIDHNIEYWKYEEIFGREDDFSNFFSKYSDVLDTKHLKSDLADSTQETEQFFELLCGQLGQDLLVRIEQETPVKELYHQIGYSLDGFHG